MCGQQVSPYNHCSRVGTAVTVNGWFGEEVEGRCVGSKYLLTITAVEVARQLQENSDQPDSDIDIEVCSIC